jgi:hypothetical protein
MGLGLKACPLCFYQRSFMLAAAAVVALLLLVDRNRPGLACLTVVPLAWAGLTVAAFHEYLVVGEVLECPPGLWGLGTSLAQSLAAFALLTLVCSAGAWVGAADVPRLAHASHAAGIVLGVLVGWGCIASAPPLPPEPVKPYDPVKEPLVICRPPYRGA